MSSLLAHLPAPSKQYDEPVLEEQEQPSSVRAVTLSGTFEPPPYLRRRNFVPRKPQDFGDGGAFPEIHVAQVCVQSAHADVCSAKEEQCFIIQLSAT